MTEAPKRVKATLIPGEMAETGLQRQHQLVTLLRRLLLSYASGKDEWPVREEEMVRSYGIACRKRWIGSELGRVTEE